MSFDESVFSVGLNQKTVKEDLFVKRNHGIPSRNRRGKTLEDSRRRITIAGHVSLTCGAAPDPPRGHSASVGATYQPRCYVGSPPP